MLYSSKQKHQGPEGLDFVCTFVHFFVDKPHICSAVEGNFGCYVSGCFSPSSDL